jgi:hypothetical protein
MSKDVFERDREFYQQRGIGNKMGFGKKPAVVELIFSWDLPIRIFHWAEISTKSSSLAEN